MNPDVDEVAVAHKAVKVARFQNCGEVVVLKGKGVPEGSVIEQANGQQIAAGIYQARARDPLLTDADDTSFFNYKPTVSIRIGHASSRDYWKPARLPLSLDL